MRSAQRDARYSSLPFSESIWFGTLDTWSTPRDTPSKTSTLFKFDKNQRYVQRIDIFNAKGFARPQVPALVVRMCLCRQLHVPALCLGTDRLDVANAPSPSLPRSVGFSLVRLSADNMFARQSFFHSSNFSKPTSPCAQQSYT